MNKQKAKQQTEFTTEEYIEMVAHLGLVDDKAFKKHDARRRFVEQADVPELRSIVDRYIASKNLQEIRKQKIEGDQNE